jgi:hypothetical protein
MERFWADLLSHYDRAGRPTVDRMAFVSGRPPHLFAFLLRSNRVLPSWDEVAAVLVATDHGTGEELDQWRRRWLWVRDWWRPSDGRHQSASESVGQEDAPPAEPVNQLREEGGKRQARPLTGALAAVNAAEFAAALDQLRLAAGKSFGDIGKYSLRLLTKSTAHRMVTGGKLPARRNALVTFVRGCGVTESEAHTWWSIAQRIGRGEPPSLQDLSISAAGLLQRELRDREPPKNVSLRAWSPATRSSRLWPRLRNCGWRTQLRQLLDTVLRAFRSVDAQLAQLRATHQVPLRQHQAGVKAAASAEELDPQVVVNTLRQLLSLGPSAVKGKDQGACYICHHVVLTPVSRKRICPLCYSVDISPVSREAPRPTNPRESTALIVR